MTDQIEKGRIAARHVAVDGERVLSPGVLEWDARGRIVSLRKARGPVEDLAILPGLVDAHVHLQIPPLQRQERRFLPWVGHVMAAREGQTSAMLRRSARDAMRQLLADGATAIGEIDSTGETPAALAGLPIAGRCYRELTGFHLRDREARALVRRRHQGRLAHLQSGLSPHAPYSVSADLMRAAAARTSRLAIHCAELPEEQQFLQTGGGPFAALLQRLGRLPDDFRAPRCGAVRWLEQLGVLRATTQLVHCQELQHGDVARIRNAGASIVVCPGTIDYFRRSPPDVPNWLAQGIPVALGTDSRASNAGWSMRHELSRAAVLWPELTPAELLGMATTGGARALGVGVGALRRGRRADFVSVRPRADWATTLAAFVHGEMPLEQVVLAGVAVER